MLIAGSNFIFSTHLAQSLWRKHSYASKIGIISKVGCRKLEDFALLNGSINTAASFIAFIFSIFPPTKLHIFSQTQAKYVRIRTPTVRFRTYFRIFENSKIK